MASATRQRTSASRRSRSAARLAGATGRVFIVWVALSQSLPFRDRGQVPMAAAPWHAARAPSALDRVQGYAEERGHLGQRCHDARRTPRSAGSVPRVFADRLPPFDFSGRGEATASRFAARGLACCGRRPLASVGLDERFGLACCGSSSATRPIRGIPAKKRGLGQKVVRGTWPPTNFSPTKDRRRHDPRGATPIGQDPSGTRGVKLFSGPAIGLLRFEAERDGAAMVRDDL